MFKKEYFVPGHGGCYDIWHGNNCESRRDYKQ